MSESSDEINLEVEAHNLLSNFIDNKIDYLEEEVEMI